MFLIHSHLSQGKHKQLKEAKYKEKKISGSITDLKGALALVLEANCSVETTTAI